MQSTTTHLVRWTTADLAIFEGDRANRYEIIEGELFVTRAPFNVLVNLVSGLITYAYHPDKPSLGIPNQELKALPQAAF